MPIQWTGSFGCDNAFAVWIGDSSSVHSPLVLSNGKNHGTYGTTIAIANGDTVSGVSEPWEYIYVIAWSDDQVQQGFIGSFTGTETVHTGNPRWEVLPTASDRDTSSKGDAPATAPTKADIDLELAKASHKPSLWRKPVVGPPGDKQFLKWHASVAAPDANWIWHNRGAGLPGQQYGGTFGVVGVVDDSYSHNHDEFLIFRLRVGSLAPELDESPVSPCCPPWSSQALLELFSFEENQLGDQYRVRFNPKKSAIKQPPFPTPGQFLKPWKSNPVFEAMQAYIDYVYLVTGISKLTVQMEIREMGANPDWSSQGKPIQGGGKKWLAWQAKSKHAPLPLSFLTHLKNGFFDADLEKGQNYKLTSAIYLEWGKFFDLDECNFHDLQLNITAGELRVKPWPEVSRVEAASRFTLDRMAEQIGLDFDDPSVVDGVLRAIE